VGALLVTAVLSIAACRPSGPTEGSRVECTCTYLTDYDDQARVDVDVCVARGRETNREAAHCATESAHNHIDDCRCSAPGAACNPSAKDACKNR
jgi:hypothetical protein